MSDEEISFELKRKLTESVQRSKANGLLFSGGLDTSILAALNPDSKAITISLDSFGEDIHYAKLAARGLKLKHYHKNINIDEAIDAIPAVIKILESFDPAIPNDLVVYFGLKVAKEMGIDEVMTGDGADELFAGYDYMKDIKDLDKYIRRISSSMSFNSNRVGNYFGIEIKQPYLDRKFIDFALDISVRLKIKEEDKKLWGKWILRKAFENGLPKEIVWQDKRPLEHGSGMSKLREILSSKILDEEFEEKGKLYSIKFINKEHLYFYEIYRNVIGEIPEPKNNEKSCPYCKGGMNILSFHCRTCGGTLDWRK